MFTCSDLIEIHGHALNIHKSRDFFGGQVQVNWDSDYNTKFIKKTKAKILLNFFYMVGIRKLEVMRPITW